MKIQVNVEQGTYQDDIQTERTFRTNVPEVTDGLTHRAAQQLAVVKAVTSAVDQTDNTLGAISRIFVNVSF